MAFNLTLAFDDKGAAQKIKGIETGMNNATKATNTARDAMGRFTAGAGAAGAAGAKAGEDTAKGMEKAKAATEGHGDSLSNLIHIVEAYVAVHQVESIIDGYIEIRNKTNSVSTSAENLNAVMNEQFRIAQETRSKWEDLASTYQRISNAGRGLGLSQRQILDLTEELSMGMRLSGSSSREAAMTMMELTHAFTVGTLTGREFRVMMKDAPALMHELQVVSGKTAAEFAEMGKHGKFTAQTLVEWFDKAKGTIADKFGQTIPTISEGFTLISNAAQKFFGEAGIGSGVIQKLGEAMRFVADHFETIGKTILAVAEALTALFIIEKIIGLVKALTVAIAENPIGALVVALTVGISLLRQFGDEMETTTKAGSGFVTVGDTMGAAWKELKQLGLDAIATIEDAVSAWHHLFSDGVDTGNVEKSTTTITDLVNKAVTASVGFLRYLGDTIVLIFGGIPASIGEMFVQMAQGVVAIIQGLINKIIAGVNLLIDTKNAIMDTSNTLYGDVEAKALKDDYQNKVNDLVRREIDLDKNMPNRRADQGDPYARFGLPSGFTGNVPLNDSIRDYAKQHGIVESKVVDDTQHVKPVDLSFTTALDGAAKAFDRGIQENWKKDVTDGIARVEDEALKRAQARQYDRMLAAYSYKGDAISKVGDKPDARIVDEKEAKKAEAAFEKMRNQLRSVMEASNPLTDAQEKLAHAQEIVNKAVQTYDPISHKQLITADAAAKVMDNYRAKLADALHPFDAWVRKQGEATEALRDTSEEQERATKLLAFVNEMRKATGNVGPSNDEVTMATARIAADQRRVEVMRAEQGVMQGIVGPQHTYQVQLEALGDLLERNRITSEQYSRAVDGVREAYLAADPAILTVQQRIEMAWLKAKADAAAAGVAAETYAQIADKVRLQQLEGGPEGKSLPGALEASWIRAKQGAEEFGKTLADQLVGDVDKLNESIVAMANGASVSWDKMIDDMIQGLERLILKQLEVAAIQFAITAATGNPAAGATAGQIAGSGAMPLPDPGIPRISSSNSLPAAYPTQSATFRQQTIVVPAPMVTVENHNHLDPGVVHQAMDSREGRQVTMNHIKAEQNAIKAYSGTSR